jgi:alpha-D-ribose 1-methylphosphonate 5-triphosphate synthase subunit PhnH
MTQFDDSVRVHDWPALNDAVHHGQQVFRQLLGAMAEPGSLVELDMAALPDGVGIPSAAWAAVLTLCDLDTRIWIDARIEASGLEAAIAFHTGARVTQVAEEADFALILPSTLGEPLFFAEGTDAYPDRSTTLIVAVESVEAGEDWQLSGPGIPDRRGLHIGADGVTALMQRLMANRTSFPCGLDAFIAAGSRITAIPRSTAIMPSVNAPQHAEEEVA